MMDMTRIRQSSWEIAAQLSYPRNDALPVLEESRTSRTKDEVVNRVFAMLCTAASAYGFNREKALAWLKREGGAELLTCNELDFLNGSEIEATPFVDQIEGMWALCWCLKIVPELDFAKSCADDFVKMLPDLKKEKSGAFFRARASLRNSEELLTKCDLAYCLHWALVSSELTGEPNTAIRPYLIIARRRALEWMFSNEIWEEVSMDT
jgi:hypothetical protein